MKFNNLFCSTLLTLMLICFLAIPQQTFAVDLNFFNFGSSDDYQVFSEFEGNKILQKFPEKFLDKWESLMMDGYSDSKEKTVISLVKEISTLSLWNYYFRDLPIDVSLAVAKQSIEISKLVATEDVSGILGKVEKETVKVAVSYLKEYFSKNQIKVSFGAMEVKYKTNVGDIDSPFQYIIMYQPIDDKKGKVVVRIYSPKEIIPPTSRGSYGGSKGFLNSLESGQNIPPFIVEIRGELKDGLYGSYSWDGNPKITTIFPTEVPDFGLKPRSWQEKYIINPIKEKLSDVLSLGQLFGFQSDTVDYILKESDTEKIEEEVKDMKKGETAEEKYPEESKEEVKIIKQEIKEDVVEGVVVEKEKDKEEAIKEVVKAEEKEEKAVFSPCSKNNPYGNSHNIIFNEIAWMGSRSSANDEWIELKNVSGKDINLKGYTISDRGEQIKIVFDNYVLPSGSFVLLERTDDSSVPSKQADLIYQGSLSNKEEELYLFNASCGNEDYVFAGDEWPAGDNTEKRTMERMPDFTWLTYSGDGVNDIWGTPKEKNSPGMTIKKEVKKETSSNSISLSADLIGGPTVNLETNYCSQSGLSSPTRQVIINEVAWMGSEARSSDEWIELKNISESSIDLNGWQLLDQGNQIKVVFSSSDTINAGDFYLLERTDDFSVPNISKNAIYSGALSDNNESLRLFDSSCNLVDEVLANPDWPAGNKNSKKTMERSDDLSWHTYSSSSADSNSGLWGTPKNENTENVQEEDDPVDDPDPDDPDDEEIEEADLLITEVQVNGSGGYEYIELFNYGDEEIYLCATEETCYYLSYYSSGSSWADPSRNWKFLEGETILPNEYYIIDVFGNNGGDWRLETAEETEGEHYYTIGQLGNDNGSLAVFYRNPKYSSDDKSEGEQNDRAVSLKIDALGWNKNGTEVINVKENQSFDFDKLGDKVMGRKWAPKSYQDGDNNMEDFQLEIPSQRDYAPRPPSKIENLSIANAGQRNSLILSWPIPSDEDTEPEDLSYEIYFSRNGQIDENDPIKINEYVNVEITDEGENIKKAIIPDLYYSSTYSFAVKAKDLDGNYSPMSDAVSSLIQSAVHQKPAPYYDFKKTGRANFAGPRGGEVVSFIQGNDTSLANDDFSYGSVIDDNGTVYFGGRIDGVWGVYAYNPLGNMKWVYAQPTTNNLSLGNDGSIYAVDGQSIYSISPSGKLAWKQDFEKMYSASIAIDSHGRIYFIASEQLGNPTLFSFDGEAKTAIAISSDIGYSELTIDSNDKIFFSKGDTIYKFDLSGELGKISIPVDYSSDHPERDKVGKIEQVYVALDGTVLANVHQGWCCYNVSSRLDVLYALDNNLKIIWSKKEYGDSLTMGDGEFYMSVLKLGGMFNFWDISAVNLLDGSIKWTKRWRAEGAFPPPSSIVADSGKNIYLTQSSSIIGFDTLNITDSDVYNERILSLSGAQPYNYSPLSIGQNVMYISRSDGIRAIRY